MNPNDNDLLAQLLIHWEEMYEAGTDLSPVELAPDRPDLIAELQKRIKALKATAWLNQPVGQNVPEQSPKPGLEKTTLIGRYRLDALIAEGGFAQVWRAYDQELHRSVAVKLPKASRIDSTEAFMAEARRVARLKHPGIVTVHDVGIDHGKCFIVSEFVESGSLGDCMAGDNLTSEQAIRWVAEIAEALEYAHARGVIHRDIKPPNILIDHHGRALLADFGIAQSATKTGRFAPSIGTLKYMSPEQLEGAEATPQSDIYSIGVVLYELLTRKSPYSTDDPVLLRQEILARRSAGLDRLPAEIRPICARALEKDPEKRYASAADLAADLRRIGQPKLRGAILIGLILLACVALAIGLTLLKNRFVALKPEKSRAVELLQVKVPLGKVFGVDISPDGKNVVTADTVGGLRLWDMATGANTINFKGHTNWVRSAAFSPDGESIVSGSGGITDKEGKPIVGDDNSVRLWDVKTGNETRKLENNKEPILWVAFSENGEEIISAGDDDNVKLWNRQSGKLLQNMLGHWDDVQSVIFIPKSHFAVSCSEDGGIRLWDLDRGTEVRSFTGHEGSVKAVACTSDRKWLVTGGKDTTIRIWDFNSGKEVRQFNGHLGEVNAIRLSADDRFLIGGGSDGMVRVWDFHSSEVVRVLEGNNQAVLSLACSPDAHTVVTGSADGSVKFWKLADLPVSKQENNNKPVETAQRLATYEDCIKAGMDYHRRDLFEQAIRSFTFAIDLQPQRAQAYLERARSHFRLSNYHEGLADYRKAIELEPDNAGYYQARALALSSINRPDEALADMEKAIALEPGQRAIFEKSKAKIYADRAVKLSNGKNYAQAAADMTQALKLDPNGQEFYHRRGTYYFNNKEYDKAAADFTIAIQQEPTKSKYYLHRAYCMHYLNRMEEKEADFRKVKELEYKP